MTRTYGLVTAAELPDPKAQFVDDWKPLQETQLYRTRSVEGADVPMVRGFLRARLDDASSSSPRARPPPRSRWLRCTRRSAEGRRLGERWVTRRHLD